MPAAQRFQGAFETKEVATKLKLLGVPAENWRGLVLSWLGNPPIHEGFNAKIWEHIAKSYIYIYLNIYIYIWIFLPATFDYWRVN